LIRSSQKLCIILAAGSYSTAPEIVDFYVESP
jgi:hypothetical protein